MCPQRSKQCASRPGMHQKADSCPVQAILLQLHVLVYYCDHSIFVSTAPEMRMSAGAVYVQPQSSRRPSTEKRSRSSPFCRCSATP